MIRLRGVDSLDDVPARTTDLSVRGGTLRHLDGLRRLDRLERLTIRALPELEDTRALADLPGVVSLVIGSCPAVKVLQLPPCADEVHASQLGALVSLAGPSKVRDLRLRGCGLVRAPDVATVPAVVTMDLGGCAGLCDLEPLSGHPTLERLGLEECTGLESVEALRSNEALHSVVLFHSGVDRSALSKWMSWRAVWRSAPRELERLRHSRPFLTAEELTPTRRKAVARLRRLLQDPTEGALIQVVELIRALGDSGIAALLLDGVDLGARRPDKRLDERALLALLAFDHPELRAYTARRERLSVRETQPAELLEPFSGLKRLWLNSGLVGVAELPHLEELHVREARMLEHVDAPALTTLTVDGAVNAEAILRFPQLEALRAWRVEAPERLQEHPTLRRVQARNVESFRG